VSWIPQFHIEDPAGETRYVLGNHTGQKTEERPKIQVSLQTPTS